MIWHGKWCNQNRIDTDRETEGMEKRTEVIGRVDPKDGGCNVMESTCTVKFLREPFITRVV